MTTKATPAELMPFSSCLNSRTENVRMFAMECDRASVSFLDVKVYICDGKIYTNL